MIDVQCPDWHQQVKKLSRLPAYFGLRKNVVTFTLEGLRDLAKPVDITNVNFDIRDGNRLVASGRFNTNLEIASKADCKARGKLLSEMYDAEESTVRSAERAEKDQKMVMYGYRSPQGQQVAVFGLYHHNKKCGYASARTFAADMADTVSKLFPKQVSALEMEALQTEGGDFFRLGTSPFTAVSATRNYCSKEHTDPGDSQHGFITWYHHTPKGAAITQLGMFHVEKLQFQQQNGMVLYINTTQVRHWSEPSRCSHPQGGVFGSALFRCARTVSAGWAQFQRFLSASKQAGEYDLQGKGAVRPPMSAPRHAFL